jgi:hypothetical protein
MLTENGGAKTSPNGANQPRPGQRRGSNRALFPAVKP